MDFESNETLEQEQELDKDIQRKLIEYLEGSGWSAKQILDLVKYLCE